MFAAPPMANLLVLRSPDIHRAAAFYLRALGLLLTLERHGDGPEHYSSSVNGFVFELYPLVAGRPPTTAVRIGFSVDSVDEVESRIYHWRARTDKFPPRRAQADSS